MKTEQIIKNHIYNNGHIAISDFIEKSLYGNNGYYNNNNPFSYKNGDFITSPHIHQIFGEILGIFIILKWEELGKPKNIDIIELGSGSGFMMLDILNTIKNFPEIYNAVSIYLVEKSEYMSFLQFDVLKKYKKKILQYRCIDDCLSKLSKNINPVFFIANEFFDAFAIDQYLYKEGVWYKKTIKLNQNNEFYFSYMKEYSLPKVFYFDECFEKKIVEYSEEFFYYVNRVRNIIEKHNGGALFIDYGSLNKEYKSTMRIFYKHTVSNDIFSNIGKSDITYNVDFKIFGKYKNYYTQRDFLLKYGIRERADYLSRKCSIYDKYCLATAMNKLIDINDMGSIFKVIEI